MKAYRAVSCITPPYILEKLLSNADPQIREAALGTMLATTVLHTERRMFSKIGLRTVGSSTKQRAIYDCENRRQLDEATLVRREGEDETDDRSVSQAYDGLGTTYDFFRTVFDRNSIDDRGMRLDGYVHYGRLYNNAFWNGRQMVFGDGDGRVFTDFSGSLDVIAHELSHGVTEFAADLDYENEPGALNESMSDVFGSLVKQWSLGQTADQADWLIGNDIFSPSIDGDALRSLKKPGTAYDDPTIGRDPQPAHMDNFVRLPNTQEGDWGGVHINSGIPNHAFYRVAVALGGNAWEAPGRIWYDALHSSHSTTGFQEFADRTYHAAVRLYGPESDEQLAVAEGWRGVGIRINAGAIAAVRSSGRRERAAVIPARIAATRGRSAAVADRGVHETNGTADLTKQIEALAKQIKTLSRDVNQLKKARTVP